MKTKIFIYDEFTPEDNAMMQALYSRSPQSVVEHVKKVKETGSGKFMERFYVGYGHSSIADCGSTTIFIEGISMLGAKAVQDWALYSGQETSTRYIDMSKQRIEDPVGTGKSKEILDKWMDFYVSSLLIMGKFLKAKYPRQAEEDEKVYDKAIKARSFDILRGFLPAGITTQLSWHTNLRQAWDKLALMIHHPLPEVKEVANEILSLLKQKYAHSFSHESRPEQLKYRQKVADDHFYFKGKRPAKDFSFATNIKPAELKKYSNIIKNRPAKTGLPHFLYELGTITFDFVLDFGSFRDIQRHRAGVCRMPLLTTSFGFNDWYLSQLPKEVLIKAKKLIAEQKRAIAALKCSPEIKQYYIAMGFNAVCRYTGGLPAIVYLTELRSGRPVHPTLRAVALKMRASLIKKFPILKLNCDLEPATWDISRGFQDIIKKK